MVLWTYSDNISKREVIRRHSIRTCLAINQDGEVAFLCSRFDYNSNGAGV
jgi:hypothetical protein